MLVAALASWLIPAGEYDRVDHEGRQIIDPDSFHRVPANPAGVLAVTTAFPKALIEVADIVFYIFIIGGAFGVLNKTGTIHAGIQHLVRRIGKREWLIVPGLTVLFSIGGGTIGIAEETWSSCRPCTSWPGRWATTRWLQAGSLSWGRVPVSRPRS